MAAFILQGGYVIVELALKGTSDVVDVPSTRFDVTPLEDDGITVRGRDIIFESGRKPTFDVLLRTEANLTRRADVSQFLSSAARSAERSAQSASPLICSDV
jgi:hypothetical protein